MTFRPPGPPGTPTLKATQSREAGPRVNHEEQPEPVELTSKRFLVAFVAVCSEIRLVSLDLLLNPGLCLGASIRFQEEQEPLAADSVV